jgi:hypothetical protein
VAVRLDPTRGVEDLAEDTQVKAACVPPPWQATATRVGEDMAAT